jgi:glutamate dehydrogenase
VAQYRALIGRAQASGTAAPAMLAQLAGQARTLLMR